jgi:predicted nucleic acid-binding protein
MRVFLDTNVLAGAWGTRGLCADVAREVLRDQELVVSEQVLDELFKTLTTEFRVPRLLAAHAVALVRSHSTIAQPTAPVGATVAASGDRPILSAAAAAVGWCSAALYLPVISLQRGKPGMSERRPCARGLAAP